MDAGGRRLGVRHEDRIRRKKRRTQFVSSLGGYLWIAAAHRERGLDQADILDRGGDHELLVRKLRHQRRRQDDDVGGNTIAQLVGHAADGAELALDLESGLRLESGREARDQPMGRAAAQNIQVTHEDCSIAAIRLSRVIGRVRTRAPRQSNTALAIAAVTGPCAASPAPTGSISERWINSMSTSGTSLKRRIGYSVQLVEVMRCRSNRTRSFNTQLVA